MADFIANARTNKFIVKDVEALEKVLRSYGLNPRPWGDGSTGAEFVLDRSEEPKGSVSLFSYGGWPSLDEDSVADRLEADISEPVPQDHDDIANLVASHLVEGQVAVFIEVGAEKMRYLGGTAVAVNAAGETRSLDLADIYEMAYTLTDENTDIPKAHN